MKKAIAVVKLQIPAGQATPAPPVGPALAQHGLNIAEFCQKFNDVTKNQTGFTIPVDITVYGDIELMILRQNSRPLLNF